MNEDKLKEILSKMNMYLSDGGCISNYQWSELEQEIEEL